MRIHRLRRSRHTIEHVHPRPPFPPEVWQEVAQFLSLRELDNAAFLHPVIEAAGRARRSITITLPASGGAPFDSSRLIEAELIKARQRHVESHVRSLRLCFHSTPAGHKQSLDMKSLFRGLFRPSFRGHQNAALDFLRGFENISELLLEPGTPLFDAPFSCNGLHFPYVIETWRVLGSCLTSLKITLRHGFEGIINVLPPPETMNEPLPVLERMVLEIPLDLPQPPYEIPAEQKRRNTAVQVLLQISALYLASRKLQELSLSSYGQQYGAFDTELLSILLPSQGQMRYPSLTKFRISLPFHDLTPNWDSPLIAFLSVHSTCLKTLQLSTATPEIAAGWLGFSFPVLDKLEIYIPGQDVIGFLNLSEGFPSLFQNCLTTLTIEVFGSNSELRYLVEIIGSLTPHLDTLRIGGGFRLWPHLFFTLSIELPKLYSLMVEVSELEADNGHGLLSCPQFLRQVVGDIFRKEALDRWNLYDIGFKSDISNLVDARMFLEDLAKLIPSVRSFFMHGDTLMP